MDKIDIRDLRIDNWIYHKDCPIPLQVSGVKDNEVYLKHSFTHNRTIGFVRQDRPSVCSIDEIKPIHLDKEILEKNGFVEMDKGVDGLQSQYKGKCVYLHQLQNVLRDVGIEKEITL